MIRKAFFNRLLRESEKQVFHGIIQYKDEVQAGIIKVNKTKGIKANDEEVKKVISYIINFYF